MYGAGPDAAAIGWKRPDVPFPVGSHEWKKSQSMSKINYVCLMNNNDKYNECVKKTKIYAQVDATKAEKQVIQCALHLYAHSHKPCM
jgi:hypothetical protein